jgi:hypothetical protein
MIVQHDYGLPHGTANRPKRNPARGETERGWLSGDSRPGTRTGLSSHCADRVKAWLTLRNVTPSRAACRASAPWSGMLPTPTSRVMSSRNAARSASSAGEGQHPEPGAHREGIDSHARLVTAADRCAERPDGADPVRACRRASWARSRGRRHHRRDAGCGSWSCRELSECWRAIRDQRSVNHSQFGFSKSLK